MKHRHLNHEDFALAVIDDILDRGKKQDWRELSAIICADPYGEVAQKTLKLCKLERNPDFPLYGAPLFLRLIAATRRRASFRPVH